MSTGNCDLCSSVVGVRALCYECQKADGLRAAAEKIARLQAEVREARAMLEEQDGATENDDSFMYWDVKPDHEQCDYNSARNAVDAHRDLD